MNIQFLQANKIFQTVKLSPGIENKYIEAIFHVGYLQMSDINSDQDI